MLTSRVLLKISLLALLLVSCSSKPTTDSVSFMVFGDSAEFDAYKALVSAFEDSQTTTTIELTHIPSPREYRTRLATEFAAGSPPDITLMNYRRFAAFAANDLLEPLGPYVNSSDKIAIDDFYPIATDSFQWGGDLMCIPQNISSLVVYYNTDLFKTAGVEFPERGWTWDDFLATAQALTLDTDNDGRTDQFGLGIAPSLFRVAPFVWQNEAPIVDSLERPVALTLNRFPSLEALTWFTELQTIHQVVPNRIEEASLDSESRFVGGTTAMFFNSRRGTPTYRQIDTFTWDVAPLPVGKSEQSVLHSDGYCLSNTTENKDAAWQFIEFANSPEGQTIVAHSGRTVPSLISVSQSDAFLDPTQPPANAQLWLDMADILNLVPVISTWEEIEKTASIEIERAFYGDITPTEAANQARWRTEEYFLFGILANP